MDLKADSILTKYNTSLRLYNEQVTWMFSFAIWNPYIHIIHTFRKVSDVFSGSRWYMNFTVHTYAGTNCRWFLIFIIFAIIPCAENVGCHMCTSLPSTWWRCDVTDISAIAPHGKDVVMWQSIMSLACVGPPHGEDVVKYYVTSTCVTSPHDEDVVQYDVSGMCHTPT